MQTLRFDVRGMTCGGCTSSVQRTLSKLDDVSHAEVSLHPGVATVTADPARRDTRAERSVDHQARLCRQGAPGRARRTSPSMSKKKNQKDERKKGSRLAFVFASPSFQISSGVSI